MKYLAVFLVIVCLQLALTDQTMAQGRVSVGSTSSPAPTLSNIEFSSWVSYEKFWDKRSQGFSARFDGDFITYFNQAIGAGLFGSVAGGGGQFNDGSYNEPSFFFEAGIEGKWRTLTSFYLLALGYGQIFRDGKIGSGLQDVIFNDFYVVKAEYQAYGRRLAKQVFLPAVGISFEVRVASIKETPPWPDDRIINYKLVPSIATGAGKVTIVDIKFGELNFAWGLNGAVSMYNFQDPKVFYEVGTFLDPSYAGNSVARINFNYQNGVAGIKGINRFDLIFGIDAAFLFKINTAQANPQIDNNRRRVE